MYALTNSIGLFCVYPYCVQYFIVLIQLLAVTVNKQGVIKLPPPIVAQLSDNDRNITPYGLRGELFNGTTRKTAGGSRKPEIQRRG